MNDKKNTSYPKEKVNVLFLENISDTAVKLFKEAGPCFAAGQGKSARNLRPRGRKSRL